MELNRLNLSPFVVRASGARCQARPYSGGARAAPAPAELNQPGYKLHPLNGELKGRWSVWVNGNWRVTFRFVGTDVELVDYQDYH